MAGGILTSMCLSVFQTKLAKDLAFFVLPVCQSYHGNGLKREEEHGNCADDQVQGYKVSSYNSERYTNQTTRDEGIIMNKINIEEL